MSKMRPTPLRFVRSLARMLGLAGRCRAGLPEALKASPWLTRVWQGLAPQTTWDCHAHLAGLGDAADSGIQVASRLSSPLHPMLYAQYLSYINAACLEDFLGPTDENYVQRLLGQMADMPSGVKLVLLAFDHFHDDSGQPQPEASTFYVPDAYACKLARTYPQFFEWAASIHPYRPDAVDRLEAAAKEGARAVKWLPAAQNIDPADVRCAAFYAALARLDLPLVIHCGKEQAVHNDKLHYGNPLLLRSALEIGARVVVAHCASSGDDADLDHGGRIRKSSFHLFSRLMEEAAWKGRLFGDISAVTLRNRKPEIIKTLLQRKDWHERLLNGSDYPLPGILPIVSLDALTRAGLLPREAVPDLKILREYNPLYFDLAVKRHLNWQGAYFSPQIFATRSFFTNRRGD
ncbi:MAG: amidohydrolase [Zoogloeaceae bacterium]|jgi:mannonate dehydratase|nr:amidohydrolase [Zoogloeaceae bacterium]